MKRLILKYGLNVLQKIRADDGKGPMHWSYEYTNEFMIQWLQENEFDQHALDQHKKVPKEYGKNYFAAPKMSRRTLNKIIKSVKKKEILLAAEGYEQGKTGWYVNRKGNLLWYDVKNGEWIHVKERQLDGSWKRDK